MSTNYNRGRRFECTVRDALRGIGYFVIRSAGSKGPVDLVASGYGGAILFVQCKTNGILPSGEWNTLLDAANKAGAIPVLAWRGCKQRGIWYSRLVSQKEPGKRTGLMQDFDPAQPVVRVLEPEGKPNGQRV